MNEMKLISAIREWAAPPWRDASLVAGIGDDCAVLKARPDEDLLVTTDFSIEDRHFRRKTHTAVDIGWRALGRGLSDIAAMGGTARHALVSLALPEWANERFVRDLYRGMRLLADRHHVSIVGGDVTRAEKLTIDIVVLGGVRHGAALRRNGARACDAICVSGTLGHAAAARYRERFEPCLALGRKLAGRVSACMDLSDGLALDLRRMCAESGVAAELDVDLPVAPGATLEQALWGGEDYELLCTLPPRRRLPAGLSRIGRIVDGPAGQISLAGAPLPALGWDPFATGGRSRARRVPPR
jgi:thiamine-monophosphate kinase